MRRSQVEIALLMILVGANAHTQQDSDKMPEISLPLRGEPPKLDSLSFVGADVAECLRFEPEGMRLTLPAGKARSFTGMRTGIAAQGNFEIVVDFDMLEEPDELDPRTFATKLHLFVQFERESAGLTRQVAPWAKGPQWAAWLNPVQKKQMHHPTLAAGKKGRLRIARTGRVLAFAVAEENGPFRLLREFPCETDDVTDIRLVAELGNATANLDARISDLRVRAERLPQLPGSGAVAVAQVPENAPPTGRSPWRLWLILGIVLACLGLIAVAVARRRRPA